MSYAKSIEAAGAKVLDYEQFGSYQGDWWALVEYNGRKGFVGGSYGSCSGCDAFEAEFSWNDEDRPDYQDRLRDFGKSYLDPLYSYEEALKSASENISWDHEATEMVNWIKSTWDKNK